MFVPFNLCSIMFCCALLLPLDTAHLVMCFLQVESQLSEHAARLAELKAVEEAYLPVWLSRKMDSSFKYASDSWQQVQESEYAAQVASTVKPHWEWLKEATAPAQAAVGPHIAAAKVSSSALWTSSSSRVLEQLVALWPVCVCITCSISAAVACCQVALFNIDGCCRTARADCDSLLH
jgi:hypothetical protein